MAYSYGTIGGPPGGAPKDGSVNGIGPTNPDRQPPAGVTPPAQAAPVPGGKVFRPDAQMELNDLEYQAWLQTRNSEQAGGPSGSNSVPTTNAGSAPPSATVGNNAAVPLSLPPMTAVNRNDYGLPGGDALAKQLSDRAAGVLGRTQDGEVRGQQMALAALLNRFATGQDSVSAQQLKMANDQATATQMALAAGARPGQSQLAGLTAAQNVGGLHTALAGQQALAGIQERAAAQNALSGVLGATRGQDLQFGAQNDQAYQQALAQLLQTQGMQQQGGQAYSTALGQQQLSQQQLAQQYALAQLAAQTQLATGGASNATLNALLNGGAQALGYVSQQGRNNPTPPPASTPAFTDGGDFQ